MIRIKINDTWYDNVNDKIAILCDENMIKKVGQMTPESHPNSRVITGVFDSVEEAKLWAEK